MTSSKILLWALLILLTSTLLILSADSRAGRSQGLEAKRSEPVKPKAHPARRRSIGELSQHFNKPEADISPWMFVPKENIKEASTSEHPGLMTIHEAGAGKDIKGILKDPIKIDAYSLPWEFQTSLVQSFSVLAGVGAKTQANTAIGLNVAVTFSDPATWPKDRTRRPPDTKEFQLLVVHLGCTGEAGVGLPQYSTEPHPETYLVWGRGDLGYTVMGNWQIPYVWIGDGARYAGPASPQLYFRCVVRSPTRLTVGIKFEASHGWNTREIDCSSLGKITGIWEIGPIISADRWIPDVLCRSLPQTKGPHPQFLGNADPSHYRQADQMVPVRAPQPEPPNPRYEYYVDYCTFFGAPPKPFEELSDDFNILGYLGQWQVQEQCTLMDTHSHPGYLMLKLLGPGLGTGFCPVDGPGLNLATYRPPWEIEISFIAPDDTIPWNFFLSLLILDKDGKQHGFWQPGVQNSPREKKHVLYGNSFFKLEFEKEIPEAILAHKPLYMLIQCVDSTHVRLGFRANPGEPWFLSKACDTSRVMKKEIGEFAMQCWSTITGGMYGNQRGAPMYQKFLIDYIHYRYGLSAQ